MSCRSLRPTTSCSTRRYFLHHGSKSPCVAGTFLKSDWENCYQSKYVWWPGCRLRCGQWWGSKGVSKGSSKGNLSRGSQKRRFPFWWLKGCIKTDLLITESGHKRAMEEAHWRRRLCSIPSISVFPQQIRWTPLKKMTGGTPEVCSNKSLTLLTFNIWDSTNGPMDQ